MPQSPPDAPPDGPPGGPSDPPDPDELMPPPGDPGIQVISGPTLEPISGEAPRQLVILLHGVGSDGNDLIGLAPYFQRLLPDAFFIAPHAPFAFDMAPFGHQWFSLQDMSPDARLMGTRTAAPILDQFIDQQMQATGIPAAATALIGFSQGTMMALYVGPRRAEPLAGIVGYSGMLVGEKQLASDIRSCPPVLLVHGDTDDVVPVDALPLAVAGLEAAGVPVRYYVSPGLGHGVDDDGIRLAMGFLAEIFGIDVEAVAAEQGIQVEDAAGAAAEEERQGIAELLRGPDADDDDGGRGDGGA